MKFTFLISILFLVVPSIVFTQMDVQFRIYHKLGNQSFQLNQVAQNNLSQDYKTTRLQYYLTRFTLVHDGGLQTAISDDTIALITSDGNVFSEIDLGVLNMTQVEKIKFHIGVFAPVNNENPSLYPSDHPLAPKNPSMHWGWASGYRFLVYEGVGGSNFSQTFQLHGLDSANYFETSVDVISQEINGVKIIAVDADYVRGLDSIDVSQGLFAHGIDREDLTMLRNFRDYVFSQSTAVLGVEENQFATDWSISPNPTTNGISTIQMDQSSADYTVVVRSISGQEITRFALSKNTTIELYESGIYFVSLMKDQHIVDVKKIIKN